MEEETKYSCGAAIVLVLLSLWLWYGKSQAIESRDIYLDRYYAEQTKYNKAKSCVEEHVLTNRYVEMKNSYDNCF